LDLRKVRCFVAVAEHLNFGHVTEALHIAPYAVRQIRALQTRAEVQLFERDNRSTHLFSDATHYLDRPCAALISSEMCQGGRSASQEREEQLCQKAGCRPTPHRVHGDRRHAGARLRG
jgi:DNA-binding transcriptional LysR family regulator